MKDASEFVAAVRSGDAYSYRHGNESGTLWEKLWRVVDGKLQSKVCASGMFVDWSTYDTDEQAVSEVRQDFEVIYGRLFTGESSNGNP